MGSTGYGNFSDYPSSKPTNGNKNGGSSGEDKCNKAFSTHLEDVQRCEYYIKNQNVPEINSRVNIIFESRLIVENNEGLKIGYLPTKFNYIKFCLDAGVKYIGIVTKAMDGDLASVYVDIIPE